MRGGSAEGKRVQSAGVSKPTPASILKQTVSLRCFRAPVAGLAELPDSILVVPWGRNETPNGPLVVDEVTAEVMPAAQAANNYAEVAADFEHGTAIPNAADPQAVAAFGSFEVVRPGGDIKPGIWYHVTRWTEEGRRFVGGGHYPGVSIACLQDDAGRVIFGHSIGFVRNPAVAGMKVFSASVALPPPKTQAKPTMEKLKQAIITKLRAAGHDVPDDITDDALAALVESSAKPAESDDLKTYNAKLDDISKNLGGVIARLDKAEAAAADAERATVLSQLAAEGVVVPLSQDALKRFSAAELLKESAGWERGAVPRDATVNAVSGIRTFGTNPGNGAADKASVAAQLGLDPKDL